LFLLGHFQSGVSTPVFGFFLIKFPFLDNSFFLPTAFLLTNLDDSRSFISRFVQPHVAVGSNQLSSFSFLSRFSFNFLFGRNMAFGLIFLRNRLGLCLYRVLSFLSPGIHLALTPPHPPPPTSRLFLQILNSSNAPQRFSYGHVFLLFSTSGDL